ncbi:hypothetical protein Ancab_007965 [Ancistrocladus abbreviatus]
MGDGGVACMPLQHSVMEKFSISEMYCGGSSNSNGKLESKTIKITGTKRMKLKRDAFYQKEEPEKRELKSEKVKSSKEAENGEVGGQKVQKEEVEEGELGTLKSPREELVNGELTSEKLRRSGGQKVQVGSVKLRKGEVDKGELLPAKWSKREVEKVESSTERLRSDIVVRRERTPEKYRKGDSDRTEFGSWRGATAEIEKGEFIPDRRHSKGEVLSDDYSKPPRRDAVRDTERRSEREWSPPSGRYSGEDISPGREFTKGGNQHSRRSARWEAHQERNYLKLSSKIVDEALSNRNEYNHGKSRGREHSSGSRLKRHDIDSDGSGRKRYEDHANYASSKSRRLSGDSCRAAHSEHLSRRSVERPCRNSSSSRVTSERNSSSERNSLRRYDSYSLRSVGERYLRSPSRSERSPQERARYRDYRDRTPIYKERSPYGQGRHYDRRNRSPGYVERSPDDKGRPHDRHYRSPSYLERSPHHRSRRISVQETSRQSGVTETKKNHNVQEEEEEEELSQRDSNRREFTVSAVESQDGNSIPSGSVETNTSYKAEKEDQSENPSVNYGEETLQVNGVMEELPSMEEDMDICDTPPHVPVATNADSGRWFYLDHMGIERGPSRLCELKALVEGGVLVSDHLIKHVDSDRWVTVENAASPMVTLNFSTIVSDNITQLVSPPEAPGNLLADAGDAEQNVNQAEMDIPVALAQSISCHDDGLAASDLNADLHIDERVGALLNGVAILPGKELEIVGEVLQMTFDHADWEIWASSEGISQHQPCSEESCEQSKDGIVSGRPDTVSRDAAECASNASFDNDAIYPFGEFSQWLSGSWSGKGGDWRRNDEAAQDKFYWKKSVLNDGYPLCQMPKSGYEDPRWNGKDDLYFPSNSRKLDLPPWGFSCPDTGQVKPVVARGVKGAILPVVRINACVVTDHGSLVHEPRSRTRGKDRHPFRSARPLSSSGDLRRSFTEDAFHLRRVSEQDMERSWKSSLPVSTTRDHVLTVDELQLHLGGWYYLDGAGHEHGPLSYPELQSSVDQGLIQKNSSVFRKIDKVWVPITSAIESSQNGVKLLEESGTSANDSSGASLPADGGTLPTNNAVSSSFHSLHPQFIGYTRGKLHELVMKSYKIREFAAAVNEVLDPWITAKQPKKEVEKHLYASKQTPYLQKSAMESEASLLREDYMHAGKRARLMVDGSEEEYEMGEGLHSFQNDVPSFEDLCGEASFFNEEAEHSESKVLSWGLLDGYILARIFHFLRADLKSLAFAAATCKHWRAAVGFYKNICCQVDFSSAGCNCTDSIFGSIMNAYDREKIKSIILIGCTNISCALLEEILQSFSGITYVDIRGCSQFEELTAKFPRVNWVKGWISQSMRNVLEPHFKRSMKQMNEKSSSLSRLGLGIMDDSSGLKDYFDMVDRRGAANQAFRQSLYKRTKLFDARRSASILARDARMRRLAMKWPGDAYKRMEEFLLLNLKDIMKENTFDFFVSRVTEIENRVKSGYYAGRGLNSIKEDISKMCRDAVKMRNRSDGGDMNRIITLFIKLATRLEESSKMALDGGEMLRTLREDSTDTTIGRKHNKVMTERKYMNRSNGPSFTNDSSDHVGYSSDREIRRRLYKWNKKSLDSEGESSDEFEESSDDVVSDSESTASDTENELDAQLGGGTVDSRDGYFIADEGSDPMIDDREWGARMTKASLVPPVTRKYEVIDQYVVVADEEEVRRKMRVSLPDDYDEKVKAQKNSTEESDIPEVKEFKPRKQLGAEVIEQEVYGIDPYTHNLLLDSMPKGVEWPLVEKHVFIEDVLLRTLNKQVRHFTGTGNTPMIYPLKPVIQEILETAEKEFDMRTLKLFEAILQAIDSRPEDNYVAYRKGLGVVCNKEGGFGEDDFVVEFLGEVYPAWKWYEKQDGVRSLQKNHKDPAPEFYNINLERPKGDADGYDLVVVDAMHKANYASRICHSCRPNCEAKVTAVGGQYQIGIYTVRPIGFGEEITFDYNSVTESREEYEASVCLCGSQVCRGSYLNLVGEGAFQKVLKEWHGLLDRHRLMLEACELNWVSEEDFIDLGRAGLGNCLLGGLPDWLIAYSARLVRFINFERTKLPDEILRHNLEEKTKYFAEICFEVEKSDAEIQAEGVYNQRLQNLALTLDKVRHVLRCVFGDPKKAPPPLRKLSPEEMVSLLWKGEGSFVQEFLQSIAPHMEDGMLDTLKSKIRAHDPSRLEDIEKELRKSLLWLRDEVRNLPCTYKCRHDAAADLIHIYAYTKCFFKIRECKAITSPPVYISPLDLGPKCSDKLSGLTEYCKIYGENYCLGQLIYWYNQATDPDRKLARASRGCLSLPEIGSFYAKAQKPSRQRVYGPRTVRFMLMRMEKQPQRPWPKDRIWSFESSPRVFGSPMLDAILNNSPLEREMVNWLKNRPAIFHAMWDR